MKLDFTKLNNLSENDIKEIRQNEIPEDLKYFQRAIDQRKEESEKIDKVYETYQDNIKVSGQLITDIVKGVSEGEDIYSLFLKAVEALGLCTGDTTILSVCEKNLEIVYGYGGVSNSPLEVQLQDTEQRLHSLIHAKQTESDSDVIKRVETAIKTHETQIDNLRKRINQL